MKKNILDSIFSATMKLPLRRTLVRSVMLLNKPTPGHLQHNQSLSSPLRGGEVFQSTTNNGVFIPSLEGQQQLITKKNLKGVGFSLLLFLLHVFSLLTQQATWIWYRGDFEIVFNFKVNDNQTTV